MSDKSKIEWTDATWNPIRGCSRISEGCRNCYAETVAKRFRGAGLPYEGLIAKSGQWNGNIKVVDGVMHQPMRWKKPRRIFVNSMSDLFHENVPDCVIDEIFAVMALCPQHTFQVLTKRPARMLAYCATLGRHHEKDRVSIAAKLISEKGFYYSLGSNGWHLPNVWLGVSVEDQTTADERIPLLLKTKAAVRWISAEPLIGSVNLSSSLGGTLWIGGQRGCTGTHSGTGAPGCPKHLHHHHDDRCEQGLDWVVVGGESGKNAREIKLEWARSIRDQCVSAGIPFFFKQWGEWGPNWYNDTKREKIPGSEWVSRMGKKITGRALDGRTWDEYPTKPHGHRA